VAAGERYETEGRRLKEVVNLEEKFGLFSEFWQPARRGRTQRPPVQVRVR
jgi:hypothetical protein